MVFSHKKLTQQKKLRERERKELETLGRRNLANVRVVQRNVVYIVGIGPRFAKEEVRCSCSSRKALFSHFILAHSHFALARVLWEVWQNLKDFTHEADTSGRWRSCGRSLHHLPKAGRCSSCNTSRGQRSIAWRRQGSHECQLWYYQVLHDIPSWRNMHGS